MNLTPDAVANNGDLSQHGCLKTTEVASGQGLGSILDPAPKVDHCWHNRSCIEEDRLMRSACKRDHAREDEGCYKTDGDQGVHPSGELSKVLDCCQEKASADEPNHDERSEHAHEVREVEDIEVTAEQHCTQYHADHQGPEGVRTLGVCGLVTLGHGVVPGLAHSFDDALEVQRVGIVGH